MTEVALRRLRPEGRKAKPVKSGQEHSTLQGHWLTSAFESPVSVCRGTLFWGLGGRVFTQIPASEQSSSLSYGQASGSRTQCQCLAMPKLSAWLVKSLSSQQSHLHPLPPSLKPQEPLPNPPPNKQSRPHILLQRMSRPPTL